MDVIEAIESRKSVRAFRPDPVAKQVMARILEVAVRAPSTDNTQPWEFAIVTGPILAELKKAGEELTKGYEAVVKNLTIEKKIAEAKAPQTTDRHGVRARCYCSARVADRVG